MNITFNKTIVIFQNKTKQGKTYYTYSLSKKNNDKWENASMFVRFKNAPKEEEKSLILVKDAFLSFSKKDNQTTYYMQIMDWEYAFKKEEKDPYTQFGNSITAEEIDDGFPLPF